MIEEKLRSLNITLPTPPKPAGSYVPVVISQKVAYVSGQIPMEEGKILYAGKVTKNVTVENAQKAARLCTLNALAQLKEYLGDLERIVKIVRISGYVNSDHEFMEQPKVINAASDLLFELFGEKGRHTRIAVGVASLPLNSTVELDMIVEIS
ncbi:MAG: RidA family protein [Nitrosopumilaceae archaeon]